MALIVLVGLGVAGLYYWKSRPDAPREIRGVSLPGLGKVEDAIRDKAVATAVRTAFALNRSLQPLDLEVAAEDAVVTLRGAVPSEAAKATAERVASQVPEVRQVVSHLKVEPGTAPAPDADRTLGETVDDKKLELQVRLALSLNRKLEGLSFDVKTYKREVTLSGEVPTAAQKALAVSVARDTPGVSAVADAIKIRGKDGGKS
jgi:osmotically-inducible protein OsmY